MNNPTYLYFGDRRHGGTVAVAVNKTDHDKFECAAAFCSPKDQFHKAKAHAIASGRLAKGGTRTLLVQCEPTHLRPTLQNALIGKAFYHTPRWVPAAVR